MKASRCLGAWAALYLHWEDPQESFLQLLSCSWLSSCKSRFKSDFSQLLFPGIPVAAAAVHFSWSPFSGRGLSFSPAAPSHSLSYSSPSPTLSSLPNFPAATSQAQPLSLRSQAGGSWLCLCSSLPILNATISLPVQRGIPGIFLRGLAQHYTLVQSILYQQKVQLKEELCKKCWKIICLFCIKNLSLKCRFASQNPLGWNINCSNKQCTLFA